MNEKILNLFKQKYPNYNLPPDILYENDDIALLKYSKGIVLEIGTYLGCSSILLSLNAEKVYTIDAFFMYGSLYANPSYRYEKVKEELKKFKNIELIKGISVKVKLDIDINTIFIDGGHEYDNVKNDFEYWFPKIKNNGHILFHDCFAEYPGILKLCNELEKKYQVKEIEKIGVIRIFKKL